MRNKVVMKSKIIFNVIPLVKYTFQNFFRNIKFLKWNHTWYSSVVSVNNWSCKTNKSKLQMLFIITNSKSSSWIIMIYFYYTNPIQISQKKKKKKLHPLTCQPISVYSKLKLDIPEGHYMLRWKVSSFGVFLPNSEKIYLYRGYPVLTYHQFPAYFI